uniref:KIB1-4 beta-propeller domain-containing protein n=2 Tax=Hordeum vulgare subsp. vulgare TaxID=112509 RepID=A0A8I6YGP1_HORVV
MMESPVPFSHAAAPIGEGTPAAAGTARRVGQPRDRRKRRRIAEESGGWASLPGDLVRLVAERVRLVGDVVDYLSLRAACSGWRSSTDFPLSPQEQFHYCRPGDLVALCDGDETRPDDACHIAFFKPSTGRRLRVRLKLKGYRIVSFSGGLLVLVHKRFSTLRLLHPFTRSDVDLPPMASTFRIVVGVKDKKGCFLRMNAAICASAAAAAPDASIDVVAWFPREKAMLWAKPGDASWNAIYLDVVLQSVLAYRGRLYATTRDSANILQVYPQSNIFPVDTPIPDELGPPSECRSFLVESNGRMLLAVRYYDAPPNRTHTAVRIFDVDLDRRQLAPVSNIGDRALFLGQDRCLSVSSKHLPSIRANSVYYSSSESPVMLYSLSSDCPDDHECSWASCRARPFAIADHLITYCNHLEWARGLMFCEHWCGLGFSKELKEKVRKQDSQMRIPTDAAKEKTNFTQYI